MTRELFTIEEMFAKEIYNFLSDFDEGKESSM